MKFELKDFQEEAARKLVDDMTYLMDGYERRNKIGSCCLSAPTGAGKTVIAAAVYVLSMLVSIRIYNRKEL